MFIYPSVLANPHRPTFHSDDEHESIELPHFYRRAWKDPHLHRPVYRLPCWGISIGCLLCALSYAPLMREVLVGSKVRGLGQGGGATWLEVGEVGGSFDFCGFLQIRAVFTEPLWSTLSKTRSNPHINYKSLFHSHHNQECMCSPCVVRIGDVMQLPSAPVAKLYFCGRRHAMSKIQKKHKDPCSYRLLSEGPKHHAKYTITCVSGPSVKLPCSLHFSESVC